MRKVPLWQLRAALVPCLTGALVAAASAQVADPAPATPSAAPFILQQAPPLCRAQLAQLGQDPNALTREPLLSQWLASVTSCQHVPDWLAQLGHALNRLGRHREAADHLERALLLAPELQAAHIDYAIALAGVGDRRSAMGLLDQLLAGDEGLEPALRTSLQRQYERLLALETSPIVLASVSQGAGPADAPAPAAWQLRKQAGLSLGHDSNLLGAPGLSSLALTLLEGTIVLPLEPSYLATPGLYHRAELLLHARHVGLTHRPPASVPDHGVDAVAPATPVVWDVLAVAAHRNSPDLGDARSHQFEFTAERSTERSTPRNAPMPVDPAQADPAHGHYLRLSAARLDTRLGGVYNALGVAAGWGAQWRGRNGTPLSTQGPPNSPPGLAGLPALICQTRLGAEAQSRQYQANPQQSGRYIGLAGQLHCHAPASGAAQGPQGTAALRAGRDTPTQGPRPGGAQDQVSLQLQLQLPAAMLWPQAQGRWQLDLGRAISRDAEGYSPWLSSGAPRRIDKHSGRLEYQRNLALPGQPPGLQWRGNAGLEWVRHKANLPLFQLDSWGPYIGLRADW